MGDLPPQGQVLSESSKQRPHTVSGWCVPQRPPCVLWPWLLQLLQLLVLLLFVMQTHAAPGDSDATVNANISIALASPQIVYTPFLCNAAQVAASPQICADGWQAAATPPSSPTNPPLVSVSLPGPITDSSNLIPQLFFQFQASALYLQTIGPSNATANVTINSNGTFASALFDSSSGFGAVVNLPANVTSLFTITLIPQTAPTVFVLQGITVTAADDISLSSLFPSATLPPSASLPVFPTPTAQPTSSSSSSSTSLPLQTGVVGSNTKKKIAEAVGITIGVGLGLTALAVLGFYFWRKRRRRTAREPAGSRGKAERGAGGVAGKEKRRRRRTERRSRNGNGNETRNGTGNGGEGRHDQELSPNANSPHSEWSSDSPQPPRHRPKWPV